MPSFDDIWEDANEELPTEEIQDIIGGMPSSITRWGISVLSIIMLIGLIGSYFFKYPDIIRADATLVTKSPAIDLFTLNSGKIKDIFFDDKSEVAKGDIIAYLESPINFEHYLTLSNQLDSFDLLNPLAFDFNKDADLGQLNINYSLFIKSLKEYQYFSLRMDFNERISLLNQKNEIHKAQIVKSNQKLMLLEESLLLKKKQYERDSLLYLENFGSKAIFDNSKSEYLQLIASIQDTRSQIDNLNLSININNEQIILIHSESDQTILTLKLLIEQNYKQLLSDIQVWEQQYLLIAPIDGTIAFTNYWNKSQFVPSNTKVFTIVPNNGGDVIARLKMPTTNSGKVKIGQRVIIKLESYPARKFGSLTGNVSNISDVPESYTNSSITRSYYIVEVALPDGLTTNYNKSLDFHQMMNGSAEIITQNNRLIEKLYLPIKEILSNNI